MIVSPRGEPLNLRRTIFIFQVFSHKTSLLISDLSLNPSTTSGTRNPFSNTRWKTWRPTLTFGPISLLMPTYALNWHFGFNNLGMHIRKNPLNSKRVSEKCHSLLWGSLRIIYLWHIRIEMCYILWFLGLYKVLFTFNLFSLFCPFLNFVLSLNYVCVNSLQGMWRMRGNLFSLVLACSSNLNWGLCSF
jgi:hypothetical protein